MPWRRFSFVGLFLLFLSGSVWADARIERAAETMREGVRCLEEARELDGMAKQVLSEKALNLFHAAQELLEPLADEGDAEALRMLSEVQSLSYWCHKMTPIAPEKKKEVAKRAEAEKKARKKEKPPEPEETEEEYRERIAAEELEAIRAAESTDADGWRIMARYFRLADEFSDTRAGIEANRESLRLQKKLWGGGEGTSEPKGDWRKLKRRVRRYLSLRKKMFCRGCDGEHIVECRRCKGTGWLYKYYNNVNKVNWDLTRKCRRCNADGKRPSVSRMRAKPVNGKNAGRIRCTQTGCFYGFNMRHFERAVWDYRPPSFRERVMEKMDGLTGEAFARGIATLICENDLVGAPDPLRTIADNHGLDPDLFRTAIEPHAKEELGRPFTRSDYVIKKGNPHVRATFERVHHGKVVRTFRETLECVWEEDEWYFAEPE